MKWRTEVQSVSQASMQRFFLVEAIVKTTIAASIMFPCLAGNALAGEGFFDKIGDGPKRVLQDIVTPNRVDPPAPQRPMQTPVARYAATMRVDCMDAQTGAPRGDNTITAVSNISLQDAQSQIFAANEKRDICQANGDTTRVYIPGTFRWM
jgi:hypothetical protein